MTTTQSTARRAGLLSALTLLTFALSANAQPAGDRPIKPEVMLLIGSGTTMQYALDADSPPECEDAGITSPADGKAYALTRMNIVQRALAGRPVTPAGGPDHWCVRGIPGENLVDPDGTAPHSRPMCCSGVGCANFAFCGPDSGNNNNPPGQRADASVFSDGVIHGFRERVKFGLATLDGGAGKTNDAAGHYSYGNDIVTVPAGVHDKIGDALEFLGLDKSAGLVPTPGQPNFGIRSSNAVQGGLISGNDRGIDSNGVGQGLRIGEDPVDIERHNDYVMQQVRGIVPFGPRHIASALQDLLGYYEAEVDDGGDPSGDCRLRQAILIVDGHPDAVYGGEACDGNCPAHQDAECRDTNGVRYCVYPEGYPYADSAAYAGQLHARGVELFIVRLVNPDAPGNSPLERAADLWAARVAKAGSPGRGPAHDTTGDGQPDTNVGYFKANSVERLRSAVAGIVRRTDGERTSYTRPLVVNPNVDEQGAEADRRIRQWRFVSFTETVQGDDTASYGRLDREQLRCGGGAVDDGNGFEGNLLLHESMRRIMGSAMEEDRPRERAVGVSGFSDGAFFQQDGEPEIARELFQRLVTLGEGDGPDAVDATEESIRRIARRMLGYFGPDGVDDGPPRRLLSRQLGAMRYGDLVAIRAPRAGVESPAYQTFWNAHRLRPTVIATGAADGQIHFFRARDEAHLLSYVPLAGWLGNRDEKSVDGPLDVGDVALCRAIGEGGGDDDCPADAAQTQFRSILVGATRTSDAIFGLDVTRMTEVARAGRALNTELTLDVVLGEDRTERPWSVIGQITAGDHDVPLDANPNLRPTVVRRLGPAVSRPVLTHVRRAEAGSVRVEAAVVVGCGDDRSVNGRYEAVPPAADSAARTGRCILVVSARNGEVIREFNSGNTPGLAYPMVGSPVPFPVGGVAPAERIYLGDSIGQMWRLDLRGDDPASWSAEVAWPPAQGDRGTFALGRPVVDRPSVVTGEDGRLVVVYGTGVRQEAGTRSYMVSFTDGVNLASNDGSYLATLNWVMPLRTGEHLTGPVVTRDSVSMFTTLASGPVGDGCAERTGRLYGVHYQRTGDSFNIPDPAGGGQFSTDVVPSIPSFDAEGNPGDNALALILPPGRVAYGLALAGVPGCDDDEPSSTEVVLNLTDDSGNAGVVRPDRVMAERVSGNSLAAPAPNIGLSSRATDRTLAICLDCDPSGRGRGVGRVSPFPSVVQSWGSSFMQ